jgi:hypothetical protein
MGLQVCTTTPICLDGVLLTFCLGLPGTMVLLIFTSQVAGITEVKHHAWPKVEYFLRTL